MSVRHDSSQHNSQDAVAKASKDITTLAYSEGLEGHARAIEIRDEQA